MVQAAISYNNPNVIPMTLTKDGDCVAYYESLTLDQSLDPYANCHEVMPGCTILDEYIGHGDAEYLEATVVLDPIFPSFHQRVRNAWTAIKAIFA